MAVITKKAARFAEVALDQIRTDGGTQQRDVDDDAVADYAERCRGGSRPPPIQLVWDGKHFWLWDGFHRYHAARAAGWAKLRASVTEGTQREAVWLSFGANKDHGVRRPRGAVREIIEKILDDPEWAKMSAAAIAEHVGASDRYVKEVASTGGASCERSQDTATRTVTRGKTTYEMRKPPKPRRKAASNGDGHDAESDAPEPTHDAVGNPLTDPAHRRVFARAAELDEMMRAVSAIKGKVKEAIGEKDPLYAFLIGTAFGLNCDSIRTDLKSTKPYALCPAHPDDATARAGCRWCRDRRTGVGCGWLAKSQYEACLASLEAAASRPAAAAAAANGGAA